MKLGEILTLPPGALIKGVSVKQTGSDSLYKGTNSFFPRIDAWDSDIKDNVIPSSIYKDGFVQGLPFKKANNLYNSVYDMKHNSSVYSMAIFSKEKELHDIRKGRIVGMSLGESVLMLDAPNGPYRNFTYEISCLHKALAEASVVWFLLRGRTNINFYNTILESGAYLTPMEFV